MRIIIVGGGKVGYYLAKAMIEHHHDPVVIDSDKKTCSFIANNLDIPVIYGDGTDPEILKSAGAEGTDAIISVTGKDENNLVACQLAKQIYHIPKTVAKVNNPKNAVVLKLLGVDNVINSTDNIAAMIEREVDTSKIKQLLELNHGEAVICEIQLPENYVLDGTMLMNIKLPALFNIVSINRGNTLIIPRGQSELKSGDKLLVISEKDSLHQLRKVLKLGSDE